MSVEIERSVGALADRWDELADLVGAPPWHRAGWIDAWWRAFGRGALELITVRRGDELVGVLPMARRRGALATTANWHTPSFEPLAIDPEAMAELWRAALARPRAAMLTLWPLPVEGPSIAALREAAKGTGHRLVEVTQLRSPYVELGGTVEEFLARGRPSRSVLKEIRRCRRRLEVGGELSFEVRDGTERLGPLLEECFEVEAAGWQGANGSAMSSRPETRVFYTQIARWAAERGSLRLLFLRVGDSAIAAEYCLQLGGVLFDLKGGYRTEERKNGPGKIIALDAIEWAYGQGLDGLDLAGDDDPYKLQWTDRVRERISVRAFAPSPAGSAAHAGWERGRPLAIAARDRARELRDRAAERGSEQIGSAITARRRGRTGQR